MNTHDNHNESLFNKAKRVVKNQVIPGMRNSILQEMGAGAGAALGTLYGIKKKKLTPLKAIANHGLKGMAIGDTMGSVVIPNYQLTKLHRKEFGTNPSMKDYGKIFAVNTLPTAAAWGAILKNKKLRKINAEGLQGTYTMGKKFQSAVSSKDISKLKNIKGAASDTGKAALVNTVINKAVEAPTYAITPESLIAKKKKKMEMNKKASEIIDSKFNQYLWR